VVGADVSGDVSLASGVSGGAWGSEEGSSASCTPPEPPAATAASAAGAAELCDAVPTGSSGNGVSLAEPPHALASASAAATMTIEPDAIEPARAMRGLDMAAW
jgi:hypothetical protein